MTTRPSDPDHWYDPDGTDAAMLKQIRAAGEYQRSDPPPLSSPSVHHLKMHVRGAGATFHPTSETCPLCEPAPVPEGMETTAEGRRFWADHPTHRSVYQSKASRDLDRAIAEIASLTTLREESRVIGIRQAARIAELEAENGRLRDVRDSRDAELRHSLSERQRLRKEWETANNRIAELEDKTARVSAQSLSVGGSVDDWMKETIAQVAAAVLAEREACARIAADWLDDADEPSSADDISRHIAATIRARPTP